jgi:hypothetical protein
MRIFILQLKFLPFPFHRAQWKNSASYFTSLLFQFLASSFLLMFSNTGLNHLFPDHPTGLFSLNCNSNALLTIHVPYVPLIWPDHHLFTDRPSGLYPFRIHSEIINLIYTVSRTPWTGDLPIRRLPTQDNINTQISMSRVRFEPMIPVFEP